MCLFLENVSAYIHAVVHTVMQVIFMLQFTQLCQTKKAIGEEAAKHQAHKFAVINYNDLLTHHLSLSHLP